MIIFGMILNELGLAIITVYVLFAIKGDTQLVILILGNVIMLIGNGILIYHILIKRQK